ncbi:MAG TPA: HEPN domain-containing protein [Azospirillum sp.]|nr:HEPN domain-containing protein [Azospirillum sp.]
MNPEALHLFMIASGQLAEARTYDPAKSPRGIAHATYYAMFHAARALLLKTRGTVSSRHGSVHSAFEALVAAEPATIAKYAQALRAAYQTRLQTDYIGDVPSLETAEELLGPVDIQGRWGIPKGAEI